MKRYNSMQIFTAMLAVAVLLVAGCTKNDLVETNRPLPPAGMGELMLGELRLTGDVVSDPNRASRASDTDDTSDTSVVSDASRASRASDATRAQTRAVSVVPEGSTLRIYAFKEGETDFSAVLATRTYTVDASGKAQLDAGQDPLYVPLGKVDIYLAGPVTAKVEVNPDPDATPDTPVEVDIAAAWGISPRQGVDLIAGYAATTIAEGTTNPLPVVTLEHKMARVQVVVSEHAQAAYENLNVMEVKLYAQPQTGSYVLDTTGGAVTADENNTADVTFATIAQEQAAKRFSITTVLLPQVERELKIETLFECNQKNVDVGDNHPKLKYRQSGLVVSALAAGSATQFTTAPLTPVEIKWRTKVLPWNDVEGGDFVIPGLDLEVPYVEISGLKWATGNLVAYGQNDCRVGRPSDGGLFFQFGSLIGWSGGTSGDGTGQSQGPSPTIPSLNQQVWPVEMGATKPTFGWQNRNGSNISTLDNYYFNYSSGVWGTENADSDIGTFSESISGDAGSGNLRGGRYATLGVGDPCTYYLGEPWRTPTQTELLALKNSGYSSWTTVGGMPGRWFGPNAGNAQTSIFLGAAAHRYPSTANIWYPDSEARYNTGSVKNATQNFYMYANNSKVISPDAAGRSAGLPARCVSGKYMKHKPEPPAANQIIEFNGLKWTKGNLVATDAVNCKVGAPGDYGVYFQFGSLVGWAGGADGTGVGQGLPSLDQQVWPIEMGTAKPTFGWQQNAVQNHSGLTNYYFNYTTAPWSTSGQNIREFGVSISGDGGSGTLATGRYAKQGVGDPCSYYLGDAWRLPTAEELTYITGGQTVTATAWTTQGLTARWVTQSQTYSGVSGPGVWVGEGLNANSGTPSLVTNLFLPASGVRLGHDGSYYGVGFTNYVWSNFTGNYSQGQVQFFNNSTGLYPQNPEPRSLGAPARCVSGKYVPPAPQHKPEEPAANQIVEIDGLQWTTGNLVARDAVNCKVGAPEDGGLYFQFGSLIGWKGGATGDGTGRPTKADGSYYNGTTFDATGEVGVVPVTFSKISDIGTTWPNQTTNLYYFGLSTYLSADLHLNNAFSSSSLSSSGVGDPCRYYLGGTWRMPTAEEIKVMDNAATKSRTGTWAAGTSTDSYFVWTFSGSKEVKFPAVGLRNNTNGTLQNVGNNGFLWSSWTNHIGNGYNLYFNQNSVNSQNDSYRRHAIPVRCVSGTYLPPAPPHNPQEPAADQIVEIDGLQWTTGNLVARDASNCKVGAPEDGGLYFQFGSLLGWKGGATGDGTGRAAKANNSYYNSASFITPAKELSVVPANFSKINDISYGQWPNNAGTNRYYFGYNTSPYETKGTNIQDYPGVLDGSLAKDGVGDPCRYYLGGTWRMPTTDDFEKTQTAANESWLGTWVSGTSTNSYTVWSFADGNELKFPAVGYRDSGYLVNVGRSANYWTSLIERGIYGHYMSFPNNNSSWLSQGTRRNAYPIRCVRPK